MSQVYTLVAEDRADTGKGASRRLRREGKIPAIMYGGTKAQKPVNLSFSQSAIAKATQNEGFFSHVLTLQIGDKEQQVVLMDMQRHPARGDVVHMDFERVTKTTIVHKRIPLHFLNEDKCVGAKAGGLLQHSMNDVEITCKAGDLPEFIEVDVIDLPVGGVIHLSDIKAPKGVTLVELAKGATHDVPVVSVLGAKGGSIADEDTEEADA